MADRSHSVPSGQQTAQAALPEDGARAGRVDTITGTATVQHADGTVTLAVWKGSFAFVAGDIAASASDAMTVRTPVGALGVRGTVVSGTIDHDGASSFSALPDPSGAPSIVAFTNGAGSQLFSDN